MRFLDKSAGGWRGGGASESFSVFVKRTRIRKGLPWPFRSDLKADEMFGAMATMTQRGDKNKDKSLHAKNTDKKEPVSLVTF